MYFNNRPTARANEKTHLDAIARTRTFEEHQMATAMFLMTFVNDQHAKNEGWVQNELLGYLAPEYRRNSVHLDLITDAVRRTLGGYGPQTAAGEALILIDEELSKDDRFAGIPVGTVVMFRGVLDANRWGLKAGKAKKLTIPGYFVSPEEFVVVDPVMAGSYLQGVTRWHGGEDTVGHVRQQGESLKLLNRPLSKTFALAQAYYEHPDKNATLWLHAGMRFELRPAASSLSRILTPPEDTKPLRVIAPRRGAVKDYQAVVAPTLAALDMVWAMTNFPDQMTDDTDLAGGTDGAAKTLYAVLETIPGIRMCIDSIEFIDTLNTHGCKLGLGHASIQGKDGAIYEFGRLQNHFSYSVIHLKALSVYGTKGYMEQHQAVVLSAAAFIVKYDLPKEALLAIIFWAFKGSSLAVKGILFKARQVLRANIDLKYVADKRLSNSELAPLGELCSDVFMESRLARTRATYHDELNTKQRKKLLAKFYPTV